MIDQANKAASSLKFWYQFDTVTLTSGQRTDLTLQLDQDSSFEWWKVLIDSDQDDGTDFNPNYVSVAFRMGTGGGYFTSAQIPQRNLSPYNGENRWPRPMVLNPGTSITMTLVDLSSTNNIVKVTMEGYKLFGIGR